MAENSNILVNKTNGAAVFRLEQLIRMIKNTPITHYLFHYRAIDFYVPVFLVNPFLVLLLCRFLTLGYIRWIYGDGKVQKIGLRTIVYQGIIFCFEHLTYKKALNPVRKELEERSGIVPIKKHLNTDLPCLYLRCNMDEGNEVGGSVGHIAGVVNNLGLAAGSAVIFISTGNIRAINKDTEIHLLRNPSRYLNVPEISQIFFSNVCYDSIKTILKGRKVSFIYQRSILNNWTGVKLADDLQVPFVLECNGIQSWGIKNWGKGHIRESRLSQKIEALNFQKADLIVCVSKPLRDSLLRMGIDGKKILVNPNGVDETVYRPDLDGRPVRARYGLKESETVIGFIGTFGPWHGVEVLARAFASLQKQVSNLKLLLIGDGIRMPQTRKILEDAGCMEKCIFTGLVPQEEGPLYLAACDIVTSPTVPNPDGTPFFGSPTKLFEYMAMGKAIAASDLEQIGEVLQHGKTALLCKPGDAASLEGALRRFVQDKELCIRLGKAAREEVVKKYTWKIHTGKIIDALMGRFK